MRWLIIILLTGCTRTLYTPVVSSHTIIDTVVMQTRDSAMLRALFECDSAGNVLLRELNHSKGLLASQDFAFSDNELRVETRWQTKFIDRMVEVRDTVTVVEVREVVRRERYVPAVMWWLVALAAGIVGWKLFFRN